MRFKLIANDSWAEYVDGEVQIHPPDLAMLEPGEIFRPLHGYADEGLDLDDPSSVFTYLARRLADAEGEEFIQMEGERPQRPPVPEGVVE